MVCKSRKLQWGMLSTTNPHMMEIHNILLGLTCAIKIATLPSWHKFIRIHSITKTTKIDPNQPSTQGELTANKGFGNFNTAGDDSQPVEV